MNKLLDGVEIICIKDCYDSCDTLIHRKGELNRVYCKPDGAKCITILDDNRLPGQHREHIVSDLFLKIYFIPLSEYRDVVLNEILN